jgi:hypothetical protein
MGRIEPKPYGRQKTTLGQQKVVNFGLAMQKLWTEAYRYNQYKPALLKNQRGLSVMTRSDPLPHFAAMQRSVAFGMKQAGRTGLQQ